MVKTVTSTPAESFAPCSPTLDPVIKLFPGQVLFGRSLCDTLPYIKKNVVSFENPEMQAQWRNLWQSKEETMRKQYDRTLITLNEHSRTLPPLHINDRVFVQNQTGSQPRILDRIATVMEVRPNDQYIIKISGTGCLTLRNRCYLRKIQVATSPLVNHRLHTPTPSLPASIPSSVPNPTLAKIVTPLARNQPTNEGAHVTETPSEEPTTSTREVINAASDLPTLPATLQFTAPNRSTRQSKRARKPRLFYDPSTGTYTEQNPA